MYRNPQNKKPNCSQTKYPFAGANLRFTRDLDTPNYDNDISECHEINISLDCDVFAFLMQNVPKRKKIPKLMLLITRNFQVFKGLQLLSDVFLNDHFNLE